MSSVARSSRQFALNDYVDPDTIPPEWSILEIKDTPYGRLIAFEKKGHFRLLACGHSFLGGVHFDADHSSLLTAFPIQSAVYFANLDGRKLLQIGVGVGIVARLVKSFNPQVHVDVVDINAGVVEFAEKYFYYHDADRTYIEDGRQFLFSRDERYDFIVHDVYSGGYTSPHLMTKEVFERIKEMLNPKGVLCFNLLTYVTGPKERGFHHIYKTIRSVFTYVNCYSSVDDEEVFVNSIIFASMTPLEFAIPQKIREIPQNKNDLFWLLSNFESRHAFYPPDSILGDETIELVTDANYKNIKELGLSVEHELQELVKSTLPPQLEALLR
eukprot:TRINITY_DN3583_c0_g1_i1.p1 TRINITY_DN3583_c0_g1~~TRINITY_DN3583_c0_g1_i1.p1  ORF type:complete len:327 (+),score=68.06 TRINITY_DN3583_c0_g1_i1:276-1256(+)